MIENVVDIYVRLSDEDRNKKSDFDESESIQNQKKMLADYCKERGWTINAVYCDEDYSGADASRPDWNKMLEDCRQKRCNIVLCKTMSRFSRDMEMIEKYIHGKFAEWGIRFVSVVDNNDTTVKENKKSRQINGLINEWYLDDLSENIKATLSTKRKNGEFVGSFAPYGYIVDRENKNHLVVDPVAAEVVKRIFMMYIGGAGYISIAKALNADMISPPCERKKELGLKYFNANFEKPYVKKVWTDAAVYSIIRRFEYTGAVVQGRQSVVNYKTGVRRSKPEDEWDIVENKHEPIISKEIFKKAEEIRKSRGRSQKIPSGESFSLSKKVFCGECGNTMWKTSYQTAGKRHSYLSCRTRKSADGICENKHQIRADKLEELVLNEINSMLDKFSDNESINRKIIANTDSPREALNKNIAEQNEFIKRCENRLNNAYTDKLDGVITLSEYKICRDKIKNEITKHLNRIDIIKREIEALDVEPPNTAVIASQFRHINRLTSVIVNEFVDKIYVYELKLNKRCIEIFWKI